MRELGISIDPSPNGTGVCIWIDGKPEEVVSGPCKGLVDWKRFWAAIRAWLPEIRDGIKATIIREGQPSQGIAKIAGSLIKVSTAKGELTGYLMARINGAGIASIEVREMPPTEWRKAVHGPGLPAGGEAKKALTQAWVAETWPELLGSATTKKARGDRGDAVGLGAAWYGYGHQATIEQRRAK